MKNWLQDAQFKLCVTISINMSSIVIYWREELLPISHL